jgi:mono/diheme cytochrome c family protein
MMGAVASLAVLALAVAGWVYLASEARLAAFTAPPPFASPIPTDADAIARGDHLVRTRGCRGCHGSDLAGQQMWGYAVAPNLVTYVQQESPATFEAALRHGIGRDGKAFYAMPSYNFLHLNDSDVAEMYASLRASLLVTKELPAARLPWSIRWDIARGRDGPIAQFLDQVPPLQRADDPDPRIARGEYLAMTTCNECHGFGLRGDNPWDEEFGPDLVIVAAYDLPAFTRLMREGIALGERELDMMSPVARGRFVHLTGQEVDDLYTFLHDLTQRALQAGEN